MKKFKKYIAVIILIEVLIIVITNCMYIFSSKNRKTDISRNVEENQISYKITYNKVDDNKNLIILNSALGTIFLISIGTLIYINRKIVKPFSNINEIPYEIAKGNLSVPVREDKNKYFGRFTWGMNMLRENLEDSKKRELEYQKEKKTLILSLSHDIKTPLSAIKLYSKALKENLYDNEQKKKEVINGIIKNTEDIEHYVNEIVNNSREDFMEFPVSISGVYLSEIINQIKTYYKDKLQSIHINFIVDEYRDCILKCDKDRTVEVLQNIIENAIKYGDGKDIKVSFSEEEDCSLITVSNTGCTLKVSEMQHIFDSFYRGSNSKEKEGSGLGLYICKHLLNKMDGDIFAKIEDNNIFSITAVIRKL